MTARGWLVGIARGGVPRRVDCGVAGVLAVLGVLDVWVLQTMPELRGHQLLATPLVVAVPAALAWRRTHPVAGAATVGALLAAQSVLVAPTTTPPQVLTALLLSFSSAAHTGLRSALLGWAALVVGVLSVAARSEDSGGVSGLLSVPVFLTVPFLGGLAVRVARDHATRLEALTEALRLERERTAELAAVAERQRIARDLHDVVSHSVGVMTVQAGGARRVLQSDPGRAVEALQAIESTGRSALGELERMLHLMRGSRADATSTAGSAGLAELPALVERLRSGGAVISWRQDPTGDISQGQSQALYRILQEALTNAVTHAPGAAVEAALRRVGDEVVVTIANGPGSSPALAGTGHGLLGVRERAALYGGTVRTERQAEGFVLEVTMPVAVG